MRILIIMGEYLPGKKLGGPPVSVDNFCTLMKENECYIVTRDHDLGEKTRYKNIINGWNKRHNCKVEYLRDKKFNIYTFKKIIDNIKPNLIYLQGFFQGCTIPSLILAKKSNIPVLLATRGELCEGAFKKKYKKNPYIAFVKIFGLIQNINFQSTSEEETESIRRILGINIENIYYLSNIPSVAPNNLKNRPKEKGTINLIYLSRIVPKKNLDIALDCLDNTKGKVRFDIYGPIEDKEYWKKCEDIISQLPENISVSYMGIVDHDQIFQTFSNYDAFLFPTKSENYGHVIVESMQVGCIPIISNTTPWNEVNDDGIGWAIDVHDKLQFITAIENVIEMDYKEIKTRKSKVMKYINEKLNLKKIKEMYKEALNNIINRN